MLALKLTNLRASSFLGYHRLLIIARPRHCASFLTGQEPGWAASLHLCWLQLFPVTRGVELVQGQSHRCPRLPLTQLLTPFSLAPPSFLFLPFCFLSLAPYSFSSFNTLPLLEVSISLPYTSGLEASDLLVIFYSGRRLTSTCRITFCLKKGSMHLVCARHCTRLYRVCACVCTHVWLSPNSARGVWSINFTSLK